MLKRYPITIISDDKPGLVEQLARLVRKSQGNWLESRLSKLSGKFAGVVLVELPADQAASLHEALVALKGQGVYAFLHADQPKPGETDSEASSSDNAIDVAKLLSFHASGPDQPGIVQELSELIAAEGFNLRSFESERSSMPYSGSPLFEARGTLENLADEDLLTLREKLENLGDRLALDIEVNELQAE